jgi:phage baseplate assembly protein gpV
MNISGILNIVRRECERFFATQGKPRIGIIDSYDPNLYCAKVLLQPENVLTGFLPIGTEFVGNGWGLLFGPTVGDVVEVQYQEGGKNAGYIGKRFYSSVTVPPGPVPSGEVWLVHQCGSFIKLTNDTKLTVNAVGDLDATVGGATNLTSTGNVTMTTPNLIVNGNIIATGDITDQSETTNESMQAMRAKYNEHVHPGVQGGGDSTATPVPTM